MPQVVEVADRAAASGSRGQGEVVAPSQGSLGERIKASLRLSLAAFSVRCNALAPRSESCHLDYCS